MSSLTCSTSSPLGGMSLEQFTVHTSSELKDGVVPVYRGKAGCGNWFLEKK